MIIAMFSLDKTWFKKLLELISAITTGQKLGSIKLAHGLTENYNCFFFGGIEESIIISLFSQPSSSAKGKVGFWFVAKFVEQHLSVLNLCQLRKIQGFCKLWLYNCLKKSTSMLLVSIRKNQHKRFNSTSELVLIQFWLVNIS